MKFQSLVRNAMVATPHPMHQGPLVSFKTFIHFFFEGCAVMLEFNFKVSCPKPLLIAPHPSPSLPSNVPSLSSLFTYFPPPSHLLPNHFPEPLPYKLTIHFVTPPSTIMQNSKNLLHMTHPVPYLQPDTIRRIRIIDLHGELTNSVP